jgi:hypothetical protein
MKKPYALFAILFLVLVSSTAMSGETLVFGPYGSGSPDSGNCGNNWANDTFSRTYIVTPIADGSFQVTELVKGNFKTVAGPSPNGAPGCTTSIRAGIDGQMYGDFAFLVPAGADFDFTAKCSDGCPGALFFSTFFNLTAAPSTYAWQFHYRTDHNGSWDNTDHGNTGDIHN